jgi:maltooligosyltrehalose trehalohydrolase
LAASLLLLAPHPPLLFMGEEYGETNPFPFFCSFHDPALVEAVRRGRRREFADFAWQGEVPDPQSEETFRAAVLSWDWEAPQRKGLRQLYQDLLAARKAWPAMKDFVLRSCRVVGNGRVLKYRRGCEGLLVLANLRNVPMPMPTEQRAGHRLLFRSEAIRYGGTPRHELAPFECVAFGPADWLQLGI